MAWFVKFCLVVFVVLAGFGAGEVPGYFPLKLMSCLATAVVVLLDSSRYRWVAFMSVLIWLFFLSALLNGHDSTLEYGFLSFQWIFILAALTCAPYRGVLTGLLSLLLSCGITVVAAVGAENIISDNKIIFFGVTYGFFSLSPLLVPTTAAHARGAIFHFLGLQQTILRVAGIMMFYSFKPVLLDFDLAYSLSPLFMGLAAVILVAALLFKSQDFWDRAVQTVLSLFILSQALLQQPQAQWLLLGITFTSFIYSMTSRGTDRGLTLLEKSVRPLENAGFGSALFTMSTYLIYMTRQEATPKPFIFWMTTFILIGMASWFKNVWPVEIKAELRAPRFWLYGKIIFEAAVVLFVLAWGGYRG